MSSINKPTFMSRLNKSLSDLGKVSHTVFQVATNRKEFIKNVQNDFVKQATPKVLAVSAGILGIAGLAYLLSHSSVK